MEKLKVGVVGVGVLGKHHTRIYTQCNNVDLIGVYDKDPAAGMKASRQYGTNHYETIDQLLDRVDAVSLAVPTNLHYDVAVEVLNKHKHVLLEKPLAATIEQGKQLLELANQKQCILHVGHVERYNPVIEYLEKIIDNPRFIEAHRLAFYPPPREGMLPRGTEVGVVLDLMIHDIDIILSLVKSEITAIDAVGIPILSRSEDIANARIKFANGCVANLTASRVSQERVRKIRIFQKDAYLSLDYQNKKGEVVRLQNTTIKREPVPIEDHDALTRELSDFIDCCQKAISSGKIEKPKVPAEHGLKALEIADQITHLIIPN